MYWGARVDRVLPHLSTRVRDYLAKLRREIDTGAELILAGEAGSGKTSIAVLVIKQARTMCKTAHFVSPGELREAQKNGTTLPDGKLLTDRVREVQVLVIDGLRVVDAQMPYWGASDLEELLIYRRQHGLMTVVTTNMDAAELRQHFMAVVQNARTHGTAHWAVMKVPGKGAA